MKGCNKQSKPMRKGQNRKSKKNQHKAAVKEAKAEVGKRESSYVTSDINKHLTDLSRRMTEKENTAINCSNGS